MGFQKQSPSGRDHQLGFHDALTDRVTELKESDSFLRTPCPVPVGNPGPFSLKDLQ